MAKKKVETKRCPAWPSDCKGEPWLDSWCKRNMASWCRKHNCAHYDGREISEYQKEKKDER